MFRQRRLDAMVATAEQEAAFWAPVLVVREAVGLAAAAVGVLAAAAAVRS